MGYLIARVGRVYGQSYRETMGMPMRAFWQWSGYTSRLLVAEAIDSLEVAVAATDSERARETFERMAKAAPNPITFTGEAKAQVNAVRDEGGFNDLRGAG